MKKLYEEQNIQNIANAIRKKNGTENTYKTSDMAQAISDIKTGTEELTTKKCGTFYPSGDNIGFSKVNVDVINRALKNINYVDENLKFVKPDEWDNIESISIDENASEVYYLYDNTGDMDYCAIQAYVSNGGKFKYEYGRIVNGTFNVLSSELFVNGAGPRRNLKEMFPNEDYIVVKVSCELSTNNITSLYTLSFTHNGYSVSSSYQRILMRYGNLPKATTITIQNHILVSDNVINCKSLTTLYGLYYQNEMLVRHRHYGWDTTNVSNASNMFYWCNSLCDCDTDFSGWFSGGKLTSMSAMFYYCGSLRGEIDVSGWVTDNVTIINSIFTGCYGVTNIKGIENWYLPRGIGDNTSGLALFYNCSNLYQENGILDLSNWHLGEFYETHKNFSCESVFNSCYKLKRIDISTWKLPNITSLYCFCNNCYDLEEIKLPEHFGDGGNVTNMQYLFFSCASLKKIDLSNLNVSKVTNIYEALYFCISLTEFIPPKQTVLGSSGNSIIQYFSYYCVSLKSLDLSWIDLSKFTYNNSSFFYYIIYLNNSLVDLIPPLHIHRNISLVYSLYLSRESLLRILNNLDTVTTATTLTLGTALKCKLTTEELAIATDKGWTVA